MKFWRYIYIFLFTIVCLEFLAVIESPDNNFHLITCNVGQGDAILMIYKKTQILVDGGPDKKVLNCLGKYLPFWDRELELVILTHPDADHFGGLTEVFKNYKVDNYLANPITIGKQEYEVLEKWVGRGDPNIIYPHTGQQIKAGLIQLDILAPAEQLTINNLQFTNGKEVTEQSTNTLSIVSLASFGKFRAILTGDATGEILDDLAKNWTLGQVNYIKISHHGSRYGTAVNSLKSFMPKLAVISVGKNNYGHPNPDVLHMLRDLGIKYLRTDVNGDIEIISDGSSFWLRPK